MSIVKGEEIIDGQKFFRPIKVVGPDVNGQYRLAVDTELNDVTIENVEIAKAKADGELATPHSDGDSVALTVDKNGRLMIGGYNLFDAIVNADDAVSTHTEDPVTFEITRIDVTSAKIDALIGSAKIARTDFTWKASGNPDVISRDVV